MDSSARGRRLRLIVSLLTISLVASGALIAPHVVPTTHAAAPKPATTCEQPPAGTDPTTLTHQQLAQYGLPPIHSHQDPSRWARNVRHARHRFCFPHSAALPATAQRDSIPPLIARDLPSCSVCFAGLEGDTTPGIPQGMGNVDGQVVFPCAHGVPNSTTYAWVGIGAVGGVGPVLRV